VRLSERDAWRRLAAAQASALGAALELERYARSDEDAAATRFAPPDQGDVEDLNAAMDADAARNVATCAHDFRGDGEAPRVCIRCGGLETPNGKDIP